MSDGFTAIAGGVMQLTIGVVLLIFSGRIGSFVQSIVASEYRSVRLGRTVSVVAIVFGVMMTLVGALVLLSGVLAVSASATS